MSSRVRARPVLALAPGKRVKLYSRSGNDLTGRFPLIVHAMACLGANSCIIDGEAVACGDDGIASFDRLCDRHYEKTVFLYAFDLIELNGDDLRREPFVVRKATLASLLGDEIATGLLGSAIPGLRLNEHIEADGVDVFQHACRMGLEGIASKRKDSYYVSGRSLRSTAIYTNDDWSTIGRTIARQQLADLRASFKEKCSKHNDELRYLLTDLYSAPCPSGSIPWSNSKMMPAKKERAVGHSETRRAGVRAGRFR